MRLLKIISLFAFTYFVYGFFVNQYKVSLPIAKSESALKSNYFDYRGAINISSHLSIGSSGYSQILKSAEKAGLDFLIFTDLNLFSENKLHSSYQEGVLTLMGSKYSYLDSRIIYFSSKEKILGNNLGDVQIRMTDILSKSQAENKEQLTILTQPKTPGSSWSGDLPGGLDGIEVLNGKSISLSHWTQSKLSVLWSLFIYPFNNQLALIRLFNEPTEELAFWDSQLMKRPVNGYAGSEATAKAIPFSGYLMKFPSYFRTFELMSNHILLSSELTGNFENDKNKVFKALKDGQFYFAFDVLGDPKGFSAFVESKKKIYPMGSRIEFTKDLTFSIQIPDLKNVFFEILIVKDGKKVRAINTRSISFPITEKGIYRIQVRVSPQWPIPDGKKWISWIYSNPFYIQ